MTQIPEKIVGGEASTQEVLNFLTDKFNNLITYLTARQELEDTRYKELTSRLGVISKNQLEMKRGENPGNISLNGMKLDDVDVKEQPKRRPQHFFQIDPVDGYQIVSYGFETREAAEAYKAKLLSDNAQ